MYIFYGIKKVRKKKLGYGKDYCNACEQEAIVEKWQWFRWLHLFWIPLIPLGYQHNWVCTLCNKDANAQYKRGLFGKVVISLITLLIATFLIFIPEVTEPLAYGLLIRILSVPLFLVSVVWAYKHEKEQSKDEKRKNITPVDTGKCVYCKYPLAMSPTLSCISCKTQVFTKID